MSLIFTYRQLLSVTVSGLLDKSDRKVFKVEVVETHQCSDVTHLKYRVINKKAKTLKKGK